MTNLFNKLTKRGIEHPGCGFLSLREIESSLNDKLAPKRTDAFTAHQRGGCSPCSLLAADIEVFKGVDQRGVLESERREFAKTEAILKARLRQELSQREAEKAPGFKFSWRLAAGMAGAAILAVVLMLPTDPTGNVIQLPDGTTFEVQAMTYSGQPQIRGAESLKQLWDRAGGSYEANDFETAERLFAEIESRDASSKDAVLYRGISLLMAGRHDEAVPVLQRIDDSVSAKYYLGLAALGTDDRALATESLTLAAGAGGKYGDQARQMLDLLEAAAN